MISTSWHWRLFDLFFLNSVSSSVVIPFEFHGNNEIVISHIIFSSVFVHNAYIKVCCRSVLGCKSHWISASTAYHLSWPQIWKCAGVGHATSMPWCFWQQPCTYQVSRLWYVLWPCCYICFLCGFKCSEMGCVVGWVVPDITLRWWEPFIQWYSSTSLKTWILTIAAVITSNLAMTDMSLVSISYFCIIGISRLTLPSGTKGFGGTEGFMAPEIMRYNGEEEYTEKVKLKF